MANLKVVHRPSGWQDWTNTYTHRGANWRAIIVIFGSIFGLGFALAMGLVLPRVVKQSAPLPTPLSLAGEITEEPIAPFAVAVSSAQPTPSETPLPTHTASPTPSPTLDYESTIAALEATRNAILSASPTPNIEATRQALQTLLEVTEEIQPTIAPVYEGYATIIYNRTIIRSAPGQQYAPLFVEASGTVFPVLQYRYDWTQIRLHSGKTGYVASHLINFVPDDNYSVPPTPTPTTRAIIIDSQEPLLDLSEIRGNED